MVGRNEVETTKPDRHDTWRARPDASDVQMRAPGIERVDPDLLPDAAKQAMAGTSPSDCSDG